jgi:hypothetical protein
MASPVTLNADTLEGQLAELIQIVLKREQDPDTNPNGQRNIAGQWQMNREQFIYSGTFTIRNVGIISPSGQLIIQADEYLLDIQPQEE